MRTSKANLAFSVVLGILATSCLASLLVSCSSTCEERGDCGPQGGSSNAGTSNGGTPSDAGRDAGGSSSGKSGAGNGGNVSGGSGADGGSGGDGIGGAAGVGGMIEPPCGGDCPTDTPVCKEATDTCVQCLKEDDCAAGPMNKCDVMNTCVECLATTDCSSAAAARCDGDTCVKCESNDDCGHVVGKGLCDAGTCVQCTVADETACGGKSCNPATKACTKTTAGSVGTCKPCLADSECTGGNQADPQTRCVPMEFNAVLRPGGFCLRRVSKTCARPYTIAISAKSLSGSAAENYCGIDEENVRCEAVLDLIGSKTCASMQDTACGCTRDNDGNCTELGAGGLCRDFVTLDDCLLYTSPSPRD